MCRDFESSVEGQSGSDLLIRRTPAENVLRYWELGEYRLLMSSLHSFLASVLNTKQVPFAIHQRDGKAFVSRNRMDVWGYRSLSSFIPWCRLWLDLYWPGYSYSADLQLYFDCFQSHPFSCLYGSGNTANDDQLRVEVARLFNEFIEYLRGEAVRQNVRKRMVDARANLVDQAQSIRSYLTEVTRGCGLLIPIRVDFHYSETAVAECDVLLRKSWSQSEAGLWTQGPSSLTSVHGRAETRARIDPAAALADRDRFLDNRRGADRALFERLVGYVWKVEQGGQHLANHHHAAFLLDSTGLTGRQVAEIKLLMEERWKRVTGSLGLMFDSDERVDRERLRAEGRWALDALDCRNPLQVKRLIDYIAWYFAEGDEQMVKVKPTARARTLTMGRRDSLPSKIAA